MILAGQALALLLALAVFPLKTSTSDAPWGIGRLSVGYDDVSGYLAASQAVYSVRPMVPPYEETTARILADCTYAWVEFSSVPDLIGASMDGNYYRHIAPVTWNDRHLQFWPMLQRRGSNRLYFGDKKQSLTVLANGSEFGIALSWETQGTVAFLWSLAGAREAIRASCD